MKSSHAVYIGDNLVKTFVRYDDAVRFAARLNVFLEGAAIAS